MSAAVAMYLKMATEKKCRLIRVNTGPGVNFFVGLHPDTFKLILRAGMSISSVFTVDVILIV